MPELPEVQTVVDSLRPWLEGRCFSRVVHVRADMVSPGTIDLGSMLAGRQVQAIHRRGKRIVFTLAGGARWYVHLGMTGQLTVEPSTAALRPHTHLIIECSDGKHLRLVDPRRFGGIFWLGSASGDDGIGPEPLRLSAAELHTKLLATRRNIKTTLLDQRFIAGIGNIYADEALFAAGIHPLTVSQTIHLTQVRTLCSAIKQVLKRAIRHRGSSLRDYVDANGRQGSFQARHAVYNRTGQPCRACKTLIARIVLSQRATHFCPRCQNLPAG